jgi:hypothetical protein
LVEVGGGGVRGFFARRHEDTRYQYDNYYERPPQLRSDLRNRSWPNLFRTGVPHMASPKFDLPDGDNIKASSTSVNGEMGYYPGLPQLDEALSL